MVFEGLTNQTKLPNDLRSILTTQLSKLFVAPDLAPTPKKNIIPNKMKDSLKKSTLVTSVPSVTTTLKVTYFVTQNNTASSSSNIDSIYVIL
jgi:hypothetical protein